MVLAYAFPGFPSRLSGVAIIVSYSLHKKKTKFLSKFAWFSFFFLPLFVRIKMAMMLNYYNMELKVWVIRFRKKKQLDQAEIIGSYLLVSTVFNTDTQPEPNRSIVNICSKIKVPFSQHQLCILSPPNSTLSLSLFMPLFTVISSLYSLYNNGSGTWWQSQNDLES